MMLFESSKIDPYEIEEPVKKSGDLEEDRGFWLTGVTVKDLKVAVDSGSEGPTTSGNRE